IDATLGGGGHSSLILEKLSSEGLLIGIDSDNEAINFCMKKFENNDNVILVNENFSKIDDILLKLGIDKVDGIIADLGVSSYQIDEKERGFSFGKEARLDMRMDTRLEVSAYDVVNNFSLEELENIFKNYGEEKKSKLIAREIIKQRSIKPVETTLELASIAEKFNKKNQKIHPATRIFQGLRIFVNNELGSLEDFLEKSIKVLKKDGIIVCISFHSLEDRIVKQFFKKKSLLCICPPELFQCTCNHKPDLKILTSKPIISLENELKDNPRARSAKLRGACKL
ncbi:MAG: 16S rRNA (cytosine(1402)-N(4))-methyltransferase RsmH, partial [Candidatus Muiribacteriota bacterium]